MFEHLKVALASRWKLSGTTKIPFYDRDLENFKRLHADGAISVGIIVTRGKSLHENMRYLVRRFLDERQINQLDDLRQWGYDPTTRQRAAITKRIMRKKNPLMFREAFTDKFVADKFGEATTHWRKLEDRVQRVRKAVVKLGCWTGAGLTIRGSFDGPADGRYRSAKGCVT